MAEPRTRPGRAWIKLLWPMLASIAGMVLLRILGPDLVDQARLAAWLRPLGALAAVGFVAFLAIRPVTLLPGQLFAALGGLLFGTLWATVYSLLGSLLASAVIALLARKVGTPLIKRAAGKDFPALARVARTHGLRFALIACLSPVIPTDVAQATAFSAGARFWPVAAGTLVASIPGTILTAQFGSAIGQGKALVTVLAACGMVISVLAGIWLGRKAMSQFRAERERGEPPADAPPRPRRSLWAR